MFLKIPQKEVNQESNTKVEIRYLQLGIPKAWFSIIQR